MPFTQVIQFSDIINNQSYHPVLQYRVIILYRRWPFYVWASFCFFMRQYNSKNKICRIEYFQDTLDLILSRERGETEDEDDENDGESIREPSSLLAREAMVSHTESEVLFVAEKSAFSVKYSKSICPPKSVNDTISSMPVRNTAKRVRATATREPKLRVAVCIRGNITNKMFEIWKRKLQELDDGVILSASSDDKTSIIVLPNPAPSMLALKQWSPYIHSIEDVPFVFSDWIVDTIKHRRLLPTEAYKCTLSIQCPVTKQLDETVKSPVLLQHSDGGPDDPSPVRLTREERNHRWLERNKEKFACSISGTEAAIKHQNNKHITEVFDSLQEMYDLVGDDFRANVYKRASGMLASMSHISDVRQVKQIRGIGKSLLDKIDEILETGSLKKLETFKVNPRIVAITELCKIWGIGAKTAEMLMKRYSIMSIEDLEARGKCYLTPQQLVGLERHKELSLRIPRSEVAEIEKLVSEYATRILPGAQCTVCGSYRRRKIDSGDVDILICPPDGIESIGILPKLIEDLTRIGFLTDHLSLPSDGADNERASYMGVCRLPETGRVHRRIDIKTYPRSMFAFALLYFTGSDHFNRSMRLYASKKGYSLSDKSLTSCIRDNKRQKLVVGQPIPCLTERDIFDYLGLPYKEPWERNCFDANASAAVAYTNF